MNDWPEKMLDRIEKESEYVKHLKEHDPEGHLHLMVYREHNPVRYLEMCRYKRRRKYYHAAEILFMCWGLLTLAGAVGSLLTWGFDPLLSTVMAGYFISPFVGLLFGSLGGSDPLFKVVWKKEWWS